MPEHAIPFRRLLMLQGPVGPFFQVLGRQLRAQGVEVHKINLNAGDALFYPGPNAKAFRGRYRDWPAFLCAVIGDLDIDAITLFGDTRRYHRKAIAVAREIGVPVLVFEEGYLRPDHLTVEIDGVNRYSRLMKPGFVLDGSVAPGDPGDVVPVGNAFPMLALCSATYSVAKDLGWVFFRHYRHHKPNTFAEAWPWLRAGFVKLISKSRDRRAITALLKNRQPYFFVPLQVSNDSQVTHHSEFRSVDQFIVNVMESFARNAPADHVLLLKHHPLDRGHCNYRTLIAKIGKRLNCAARVIYIHGGHLPTLLRQAVGTVTVNSTVGLSSLFHGTPVVALGSTVYNRPGLTAQVPLDDFWAPPPRVDAKQVRNFIDFLKATCQVNGSFYTGYRRTGVARAAVDKMVIQYAKAPGGERMMRRMAPHDPQPAAPGVHVETGIGGLSWAGVRVNLEADK